MPGKRVTIQVDAIAAALEAMPARHIGVPRRQFTPAEDAALLKYKPVRTWAQIAEAFGCCEDILVRRYRELTALPSISASARGGAPRSDKSR